jgi:glycerol-3-phosphate dehydrogenase (NAD(P)+)
MSFRVAVLGGGAWGTALAMQMRRAGHEVRLWARDTAMVEAIRQGENPRYLPGVKVDAGIEATTSWTDALSGADCVLAVTPAQVLRDVLGSVSRDVPAGAPLVLCAKGIEHETGLLLSEIAVAFLPGNPVAALSGPSFAADLARGLPTAV